MVSQGFRVTTAENGESGLETTSSRSFDLILLDVMMSRLGGYEVCQQLRRTGCTTPVLMLTAKGLVDDRVTGLDSGADDYLVKPFSLSELLALRRKIEIDPANPHHLLTVRGQGYRLQL